MSIMLTLDFWIEFIVAAAGTVAFSVLFFVPRKFYLLNGVCGGLGWGVYLLCYCNGRSSVEASFMASLAVIFASRYLAVVERCPATLFMIPGIFPLIPGISIYWTAYHVVSNNLAMAQETGFIAFKIVCVIVLAIIFVFEIPQSFFAKMAKFFRQA